MFSQNEETKKLVLTFKYILLYSVPLYHSTVKSVILMHNHLFFFATFKDCGRHRKLKCYKDILR